MQLLRGSKVSLTLYLWQNLACTPNLEHFIVSLICMIHGIILTCTVLNAILWLPNELGDSQKSCLWYLKALSTMDCEYLGPKFQTWCKECKVWYKLQSLPDPEMYSANLRSSHAPVHISPGLLQSIHRLCAFKPVKSAGCIMSSCVMFASLRWS